MHGRSDRHVPKRTVGGETRRTETSEASEGAPAEVAESDRNPYEAPFDVVAAAKREASVADARAALRSRAERPLALSIAVVFSGLFGGQLGGILRTFLALPLFDKTRGHAVSFGWFDYAGLVLHFASLVCLWGIWDLRRRALWAYAALALGQLAVFGLSGIGTPTAAMIYLVLRGPPIVAGVYYLSRFR
jgi:hypothetical protein